MLIGSSSRIGLTFHFTRLAIALKKMENDVIVLSDRKKRYAELPNELGRYGIKSYVNNSIDNTDVISMIKTAKSVRRIFKRERGFDVIHASGVKHGVKVFFATKRLNKKPKNFATIGSLPKSKIGMSVASISYSLFYDKCVALCNRGIETLIKWGFKLYKVCVIPPSAPDLEWFDKAKRVKINLEDYKLQDVTKPVIFYASSHFHHRAREVARDKVL